MKTVKLLIIEGERDFLTFDNQEQFKDYNWQNFTSGDPIHLAETNEGTFIFSSISAKGDVILRMKKLTIK